jgi:hypothetical protein
MNGTPSNVGDITGLIHLNILRRTHRRLFNQAFNIKTSHNYEPHEVVGTHMLLKRLLHTPENFVPHFRQCVCLQCGIPDS